MTSETSTKNILMAPLDDKGLSGERTHKILAGNVPAILAGNMPANLAGNMSPILAGNVPPNLVGESVLPKMPALSKS